MSSAMCPDPLASLVRQHDGGSFPLGPVDRGGEVADGGGRGADGRAHEVEALGGGGRGGGGSEGSSTAGSRRRSSRSSGSLLLLLLPIGRHRSVAAAEAVVFVVEGQGRERGDGGGRVRRRLVEVLRLRSRREMDEGEKNEFPSPDPSLTKCGLVVASSVVDTKDTRSLCVFVQEERDESPPKSSPAGSLLSHQSIAAADDVLVGHRGS